MKKKLLALILLIGLSIPAMAGTGALSPSHLYNVIAINTFGLFVNLGGIPGAIVIDKFGQNPNIEDGNSTLEPADVWEYGGVYNFTANGGTTYYVSSSDNSDTQNVSFWVLTEDSKGNWNSEIFEQALVGQTKTALAPDSGNPIVRILRFQNQGTTNFSGTVYVYEDDTTSTGIPDTRSKVRAIVDDGNNQTLMAIVTIPTGYVGFLFEGEVGLDYSQTSPVSTTHSSVIDYRSRRFNEVFKVKKRISLVTTGTSSYKDKRLFPDPIPAKTDVKIYVDSVSSDMGAWATLCVLLIPEDSWYITSGFLDKIGQIKRVN